MKNLGRKKAGTGTCGISDKVRLGDVQSNKSFPAQGKFKVVSETKYLLPVEEANNPCSHSRPLKMQNAGIYCL